MKFTPQRMKCIHSIDGANYSLDFVRESKYSFYEACLHFNVAVALSRIS